MATPSPNNTGEGSPDPGTSTAGVRGNGSHLAAMTRFRYLAGMVATIGGAAFLIEAAIMLLMERLAPMPDPIEILIDAIILTVLLAPFLWFIVVRKLVRDLRGASRAAASNREAWRQELASRQLEAEIAGGLEMCDTEADVVGLVPEALERIVPQCRGQMLFSDSSNARLESVVAPADGEDLMCPVTSPRDCPAIRGAADLSFPNVRALDACPKLRALDPRFAACCLPVTVLGRPRGVLHLVCETEHVVGADQVAELRLLRSSVGRRITMIRALSDSHLQASVDPLTGLMNRRSLEAKVGEFDGRGQHYAVLAIDIDHFKLINDKFGHVAGDRALRVLGQVMRDSMRQDDLLARLGGDEFIAVLPHESADDLSGIFDRLADRLAGSLRSAGVPVFTVSAGAADNRLGMSFPDTVAAADQALYRAKEAGRARIEHAGSTAPNQEGHPHDAETREREGEGAEREGVGPLAAGNQGSGEPGPDPVDQLPGPRSGAGASLRQRGR